MARVLYLSFDGMTDPLGQSQVLPYLIALSELGHSICIVSAEKNGIDENLNKQLTAKGISWRPTNFTSGSVFKKAGNFRRFLMHTRKVAKSFHPSLIHCRSYPSTLVARIIRRNEKILFDMRGFWVDERVEGGIWKKGKLSTSLLYRFFKRQERVFFSKSDHIVSLTEKGKAFITSRVPGAAGKITVIPCCCDTKLFARKQDQEACTNPESGPESKKKKVLTYLGSLGTWYMPVEMLKFYSLLRKHQDDTWKFMIITRDDPSAVIKAAEEFGIPKEELHFTSASRAEVPALLSNTDLSVFFIKPVFSKQASSPTKLGELLAAGVPVITNSGIGDVDAIIGESGSGVAIKGFSASELQRAVDAVPQLLQIPRTKLEKTAKDYFSLEGGVAKYHSIYNELAQ